MTCVGQEVREGMFKGATANGERNASEVKGDDGRQSEAGHIKNRISGSLSPSFNDAAVRFEWLALVLGMPYTRHISLLDSTNLVHFDSYGREHRLTNPSLSIT